jgi:uncharacterized protein with GYD domain
VPKYLIEGSYSAQGAEGVRSKGGSARRDAVAEMVSGLGGQVESFYFAFGASDVYVTVDVPDNEAAAAVALAVNASDAIAIKTVVLLTPEEIDAAAERSINYRTPGS